MHVPELEEQKWAKKGVRWALASLGQYQCVAAIMYEQSLNVLLRLSRNAFHAYTYTWNF